MLVHVHQKPQFLQIPAHISAQLYTMVQHHTESLKVGYVCALYHNKSEELLKV